MSLIETQCVENKVLSITRCYLNFMFLQHIYFQNNPIKTEKYSKTIGLKQKDFFIIRTSH